jgi:hypothetical protein
MQKITEDILINVVFELISQDVVFVKRFKDFAPSIQDKIESLSKNADCSCRRTVADYVLENVTIVTNFVTYFLEENPQIKINLDEMREKNKRTNVQGRIFRIHKNDDSFYQFFKHTEENKFEFRQFSVIEDQNSWLIFFL